MSKAGLGPRYRWVILAAGLLVVFGALGLSRFSYTSILPSMQAGLGLSNTQAGGLATANLAGYLVMALIGGAAAARMGPRRIIAIGLALAALGMLITGLSETYAPAMSGRVLTGMGSAAANIPAHTMVALWFSRARRGIVTGTASSGASVGLIVVGPLIPWIIRSFGDSGWRMSWYVLAGATLVLAVLVYVVIRDRPNYEPAGMESSETHAPVSWKRLYLSGSVWHLGAVYFCFGFAYMIYLTFFSKRLIADIGYTQEAAGNLFMILGWASLPCGVLWGWISDYIGRRLAMAIILLLQAAAFALFALWTDTPGLTLSAVLYGLTAWGVPAIMAVTCGDIVGPIMAPAAYGFLTFFHGLGQAAGPYVAGRMADALPSFTASYLVAAGVAFTGSILALLLRRKATSHMGGKLRPTDDAAEVLSEQPCIL
jgi:sugar phosphate permease